MSPTYLGDSYYAGTKLSNDFATCGANYLTDCTVWQITNSHEIAIVSRGKSELITADYIIIATGAIERAMPVKGWTLPGVMSVGGAQTLLKQAALGADDAVFVVWPSAISNRLAVYQGGFICSVLFLIPLEDLNGCLRFRLRHWRSCSLICWQWGRNGFVKSAKSGCNHKC